MLNLPLGKIPTTSPAEGWKLLHDDGEVLIIPQSLELDLGEYQMVRGIKFRNYAEGSRSSRIYVRIFREVEIFFKSGVENQYLDLPDTEDLYVFNFPNPRLVRKIVIEILAAHGESRESGLGYVGLITEDTDPFQLVFPSGYLSVGTLGLLFLHPYSCRTADLTFWHCEAGRLRNSNGAFLTFRADQSLLAALTDSGLRIPEVEGATLGLIPTTGISGAHSSSVTFTEGVLGIEVEGVTYHLLPHSYPNVSALYVEANPAADPASI